MTHEHKKREKQRLKELEEKLTSYELCLYEDALRLDKKRKITYIQ